MPIAKRLADKVIHLAGRNRSNHYQHHVMGTKYALVVFENILAPDGLNGFSKSVLRQAVGMVGKQQFIETERCPVSSILVAQGDAGEQLGAQPFDLFGREGRRPQRFAERA